MRIAVQWPRLGPYHLARLRAAHAHAAQRGGAVIALETAGSDSTYAWREETGAEPFDRVQVFPGRVYESVPGPEMEAAVAAALDRLGPDVVVAISYATPDARAALRWCRRRRRGAVMVSEARAEDAERSAWREAIKRQLVRTADAALVSGTVHGAYLQSLGVPPELMFTPASVVDNAYFREGAAAVRATPDAARRLPGLSAPSPFFLSSGRFIERKGLPALLSAYARYRQSATAPWRLVLLGDGPLRPDLERIAAGIDGVTFAGFRQIDELPAYYALASAYVHPARADQWGLVVNEAMAAGLPVVVSRGAGCAPDLVREGANGWTVPPDDIDALAAALGRIAADGTDRAIMGRRSQEVIAAYTPEAFAEGLWDAASAALARAHRPFPLVPRVLLALLRASARSTSSFHTVEA